MTTPTLVELRKQADGVWQLRWQATDGNIRTENDKSAADVAKTLLRFGNFEFVRGLALPTEYV